MQLPNVSGNTTEEMIIQCDHTQPVIGCDVCGPILFMPIPLTREQNERIWYEVDREMDGVRLDGFE